MDRKRGIAGVLALGVLFSVAVACNPPAARTAEFDAEVERFAEVEEKAVDIYNDAIDKMNNKEMTDPEFMQLLEEQVLPEWRVMRKRLRDLKGFRGAQARRIEKLQRYAEAREKGWVMILDGLHGEDSAKVDEGFALEDEAEKILD